MAAANWALTPLPRYFALSQGSGESFVEYIHEDVAAHGLFIYQGDQVLSPFTKLELVDAGGNGRWHIRCCYNNKFLAIRSEDDRRISAVADEPVADQSAWSCTMFVVDTVGGSLLSSIRQVRLLHVHLGGQVSFLEADRILRVEPSGRTFTLPDVSSMLALNLPRFVVFKGDNGNYGRLLSSTRHNVDFGIPGNHWDANAVYEMLPPDGLGDIRIRSLGNNRCWRRTSPDGLIVADTSSDRPNLPAGQLWSDGCFKVQRLGGDDDNAVALSGQFYLTRYPISQLLADAALSIHVPQTRLVMEEAVRSREIYNVRFNLLPARILMGDSVSMTNQTMRNQSSVDQSFQRTFTYSETNTSNWNAIISATVGVSVTIKAGLPFLLQKEISFSLEVSGSYEWGREYSETVTQEDKHIITAPPMTIVSVTRFESQGSYDIPFSYTQEEILWDGRSVVTQKHDGLYKGANNFDIYYEVTEERIILPSSDTTTTTQLKEEEDVRRRVYRILPQNSSRVVLVQQQPNNDHPSFTPPVESVPVPAAPG